MSRGLEPIPMYRLARLADCGDPDDGLSAGAQFLRTVASYFDDIDECDEDALHEAADSCVPVYCHDLWATFVDLAGHQEDTSDYGTPSDMTQGAQWALYAIAYRLLSALSELHKRTPDLEPGDLLDTGEAHPEEVVDVEQVGPVVWKVNVLRTFDNGNGETITAETFAYAGKSARHRLVLD